MSNFTQLYKNIIDEKANALLMDEETMNFNHFNLNVLPDPGILYAFNYLESLLSILGKYNSEYCKDLKRQLRGLKLVKPDEYQAIVEKDPDQIVKVVKNFEMTA